MNVQACNTAASQQHQHHISTASYQRAASAPAVVLAGPAQQAQRLRHRVVELRGAAGGALHGRVLRESRRQHHAAVAAGAVADAPPERWVPACKALHLIWDLGSLGFPSLSGVMHGGWRRLKLLNKLLQPCSCAAWVAPVACTGGAAADAAQRQQPRNCCARQAGALPMAQATPVLRLVIPEQITAASASPCCQHAAAAGAAPHTRLCRRIHLPIRDTRVGSARQPEHMTKLCHQAQAMHSGQACRLIAAPQ